MAFPQNLCNCFAKYCGILRNLLLLEQCHKSCRTLDLGDKLRPSVSLPDLQRRGESRLHSHSASNWPATIPANGITQKVTDRIETRSEP
jgi:hypothetical protein